MSYIRLAILPVVGIGVVEVVEGVGMVVRTIVIHQRAGAGEGNRSILDPRGKLVEMRCVLSLSPFLACVFLGACIHAYMMNRTGWFSFLLLLLYLFFWVWFSFSASLTWECESETFYDMK